MSKNNVKVVYIGGYGRSGSTLLDLMLGQASGFFSSGELRYIWDRSFGENQLCGCGKPFKECSLWQAVVEEAFGGMDRVDLRSILALKNSVDRLRHVPSLAWPALRSQEFRSHLSEYTEVLSKLYRALQKVTGAEFIIDSSKGPSYGFVLSETSGLELYLVHLVRDSRAVAYSWQRKKQRPEIHWTKAYMPRYSPLKSSLEWNLVNKLIELLGRRMPYLRVRYEDMVSEPQKTIKRIGQHLGHKQLDLSYIQGNAIELSSNHTVAGNPVRFQRGQLVVRPDVEWREKMPTRQKFLVTGLTLPLLWKYGYIKP